MKYVFVLVLLACITGCGTSLNSAPNNSNQQSQQPQSPPPNAQTYDMLAWMTMDPSLATSHHMSGTANPIYTSVQSDRFFWTKAG